jgi:hypothetical protein
MSAMPDRQALQLSCDEHSACKSRAGRQEWRSIFALRGLLDGKVPDSLHQVIMWCGAPGTRFSLRLEGTRPLSAIVPLSLLIL